MSQHTHLNADPIDWQAFLKKHDMAWEALPKVWLEAPFLGNGMLGTMVRQIGAQSMRWDVGRGDAQDHRVGHDFSAVCAEMTYTGRLPIGYFELQTVGAITGGTMRLDLWNAEATGEIHTDKGCIAWRSIVHAEEMLILTELEPSEGEAGCRWQWHAEAAVSPRIAARPPDDYALNPPPERDRDGDVELCIQPLLCGGETVTGWIERNDGAMRTLMVTAHHSYPDCISRTSVCDVLTRCDQSDRAELFTSHRAWWHAYYPQSFLSIPHAEWESFYWIQMYKLGSATRADRMLIDNQGPWMQPTCWPGAWWDLNVELIYWPTYASNRLELGQSLNRALYGNVENLISNTPAEYRHDSATMGCTTGQTCICPVQAPDGERNVMMGILLWGLHNCWLHYRCTMDDDVLREHLVPLLTRAVNYYYHFITEDEDGVLRLPVTWSPEFKTRPGLKIAIGPDCNFDISLFRWGCEALVASCERLGLDDPLLPKWKDTLERLVEYPCDENGFMIGAGIPFNTRHRHYSHLLMLYPLYQVNADQEGADELAWKSVLHWQSFGVSHGYALTGASSMAAAFGRGNEAWDYLQDLRAHFSCTTMYAELETLPVLETPLSGAQSIHDMLLQSWGETIRIFPAVPDAWGDVTFHDMRAEGAFLVSAKRIDGKTELVRIKSLAGEPCRLLHGLVGEVKVAGERDVTFSTLGPGRIELDLKKDEEVVLWSCDTMPALDLGPVRATEGECNSFGLKTEGK